MKKYGFCGRYLPLEAALSKHYLSTSVTHR